MVASQSRAATLDDLERQIRAAVAQRQALLRERARLVSQAAALADTISDAQPSGANAVRADATLERRLRAFDKVAGQLNGADRDFKTHQATILRLRGAFSIELERQTKELARLDPRTAAARAAVLEAARQRVEELSAPTDTFRPLLVVRPEATDTSADLDQKLAVLAAEQARGAEALSTIARDLAVLEGRTILTRRLLDNLEAAALTAPLDLHLVERQVGEVQQRLRELSVQRIQLQRLRDTVVDGLADVDQQIKACRARRGGQVPSGEEALCGVS